MINLTNLIRLIDQEKFDELIEQLEASEIPADYLPKNVGFEYVQKQKKFLIIGINEILNGVKSTKRHKLELSKSKPFKSGSEFDNPLNLSDREIILRSYNEPESGYLKNAKIKLTAAVQSFFDEQLFFLSKVRSIEMKRSYESRQKKGQEKKRRRLDERNKVIKEIAGSMRSVLTPNSKGKLIHKNWETYRNLDCYRRIGEYQIAEIIKGR